ncbi:MAG TPA: hypothetical protein VGG46_08370 [Terriglobales bacterium]
MFHVKKSILAAALAAALMVPASSWAQQATPSVARSLGTVKSISGNSITLATDAGAEVNVSVQPDAKLIRTAPGHKDLQGATPVQLSEIQTGDRMLARGSLAADGKMILASSVIVMKREDIAQKQQQEQEDWRKRGIAGVVKSVDPATQTITVSTGGLTAKAVAIQTSKSTILRRYSPDSIKFDDAKPGSFDQIKPGDQLRARGDRDAASGNIAADEIVSGTFRNIAGTVLSTDAANNTVTISDLLSKKPITVKIGADSQLHKIPQMMAMGIAARLKGPAATEAHGEAPGGGIPGHTAQPESSQHGPSQGGPPQGAWQRGGAGGQLGGGGPARSGDFQQMLARMPAVTIADLQKGDAVIVVATEGSETSQPTAITLLSGVEPILTAAPDQAAMSLSPWSLGAPSGDAGP